MRPIDAEALENKIKEAIEVLEKDLLLERGNWFSEIKLLWYKKILKIVNNAPTIEAKPVVRAHWEEIANGFMVCSHCEESVEENRKYSYCPICGAQMDELVSNTDELNSSVVLEENATTTNNTQKVSVDNHIARGGKKEGE